MVVNKKNNVNKEAKLIDPLFKSVLEQSDMPHALYLNDKGKYTLLLISRGLAKIFPILKEDVESLSISSMRKRIFIDDIEKYSKAFDEFALNEKNLLDIYFRVVGKGEAIQAVHATGKHLSIDGVDYLLITSLPVGEMKDDLVELTDEFVDDFPTFQEYVEKDELTSFLNMSGFLKKTSSIIVHDKRRYAIIAIDLTGMKSYNIKYGFSKGNDLIVNTGRILKNNFSDAVISRFGEDHFYILALDKDIKKKLNETFRQMKELGEGNSLPMRAGIFDGEFDDIAKACDKAKTASDVNRHSYFSHFNYFTKEMLTKIEKRDYIIAHLDEAIENKRIIPYYQPIVRTVNSLVCDEEALARWNDDKYGFLSPAEFVPILENARLIYKLDLCILKSVLEDFKKKDRLGIGNSSVSINISRYDFECLDVVKEIERLVEESGYPKSLIKIEITESAIIDNKDFLKGEIARLHKAGFKVWMDDFGSGYSSLNSLQDFQFDGMKIDMEFLHSFKTNPKTKDIIKESIKIAEKLGIDTICEGVEEQEQLNFLRDAGCDKVQGYLFSYPRPIEDILERKCPISRENLIEDNYYLTVGTVSLEDMKSNGDSGTIAEKTLAGPCTGVLEISQNDLFLLRGTKPFLDSCDRAGFISKNARQKRGWNFLRIPDPEFMRTLQRAIESENWEEASFQDKDVISTFLFRKIATNPLTNATSVFCILSKNKGHLIDYSENSNENDKKKDHFNASDVHIPTCVIKLFKNENGEDDFKLLKSNDELHSLIAVPRKVAYSSSYKTMVNNFDEEWIKLFRQSIKENRLIEGERYSSLSSSFLHYIISPSEGKDVVAVSLSKTSLGEERNNAINEPKTASDEVYRVSSIFKLKEDHASRMQHVLDELGPKLGAESLAILETSNKDLKAKYEWKKEGFSSISNKIPDTNYDFFDFDFDNYFRYNEIFVQKDINDFKDRKQSFYLWCRTKGIKRFIIYPLKDKNNLIGLFIVNNFSVSKLDFTKLLLSKVANLISSDISIDENKQSIKEKEEEKPIKKLIRDLHIKRFLGLEKPTSSEKEHIDRENMHLARVISVFMIAFEVVYAIVFGFYVKDKIELGYRTYYTTSYWITSHTVLYFLFILINVFFLIYSCLYLKGKLNKFKNLSQKTSFVIGAYVILCNIFGVLISVMDYQTNEQCVVFMMMILYTFLVYRLHPIKSTIYLLLLYSLYFYLFAHVPMVDTSYDNYQLKMTTNTLFMTNMLALLVLEIIICFVLYYSRMKAANYCLIDRLSSCKNRFALEEDYKRIIKRQVVVMMLDIDDFKLINDIHGHQAGDKILEEVGKALKETFGMESVYRYGGDEFLIIQKGDKAFFKENIENLQANIDKNVTLDIRITFSAGYKENIIDESSSLDMVIREADLLLYEAKRHGKNKIIVE